MPIFLFSFLSKNKLAYNLTWKYNISYKIVQLTIFVTSRIYHYTNNVESWTMINITILYVSHYLENLLTFFFYDEYQESQHDILRSFCCVLVLWNLNIHCFLFPRDVIKKRREILCAYFCICSNTMCFRLLHYIFQKLLKTYY